MQYYNPDNFLSNQTSLSSSNELNLQKSTIPNSKLNPQRQTNDKTQLNRLNNNTIANNTTAPNTGASTSTAPGTATGIGIGTGIGTSTGIGTAPSIGSSTTTKPITTGGAGLDLKESSTPQPKKIMTPDTSETKHQMQYCYGDLGASDDKKRFTEINKGIQYGNNGGLDAEDLTAYNGLNAIEKKELLIMTIDIGNGQQDTLYVYEDDDPYHVAKEFCLKHHLDENIIFPLSQNIYNNMEHVLKEKVDLLDQQTQNVAKTNKNILTHETITNGDTLGTISGDIDLDMKQHFDHIKFDDHYQTGSNLIDGNGSGSNTGNGNSNANHSLEAHDGLVDYNSAPVTSSGYNNTKQRKEMSQYQQHQQQQQEEVSTNSREKRGRNRRNLSTDNSFSDINKSMFTGPPLIIMPPKKKSLGNSASKTKTMAFRRRGSKWDNNDKENEYIDNLINQSMNMSREKHRNNINNDFTFTPAINPTSQLIIGYKYQNSRVPVHERLHNESKIRLGKLKNANSLNSTKQSSSLSRTKTNLNNTMNSELNYGSVLYHKSMKRREEKNKEILDKKREAIALEERECTFHPSLNHISAEIINGKPRDEPLEELLIRYGKVAKEKVERARNMKQIEEIESCSFKPMINNISEKIAIEKAGQYEGKGGRFDKLYDDYKAKIDRQKDLAKTVQEEECTFVPSIKIYESQSLSQMPFEERNRRFIERLEKIDQKRKEREENDLKDPSTGKPLFRPSICRPPKTQARNHEGLPIGDYLYNSRIDMENRKKEIFEREQKSLEATRPRSNERSSAIIETIKRKKFIEIFKCLDSDGDGVISSTKIDISTIDTTILEIFAPLLCEMEELNQTLTLDEFISASERLLKSLSIEERDKILLDKKPQSDDWEKDLIFKPQINKKSIKLANNLRPYGDNTLYDVYINERKEFLERIIQQSNKKKIEELKECSFKPQLMSSSLTSPIIMLNNPQGKTTQIKGGV